MFRGVVRRSQLLAESFITYTLFRTLRNVF